MKASDVIAELQALIDKHGDLDVKYYDYAGESNRAWRNPMIYFCTDSFTDNSEVKDFIALDIA